MEHVSYVSLNIYLATFFPSTESSFSHLKKFILLIEEAYQNPEYKSFKCVVVYTSHFRWLPHIFGMHYEKQMCLFAYSG